MNKLFKFFMFWTIPLLSVLVISCGDDEDTPVEPLTPTITGVSPEEAMVGETVTITGTNLDEVTQVRFGNQNSPSVNASGSTSITAVVPEGLEAGPQNITVTTQYGPATADFTVTEAPPVPVITAFEPASGMVGTEVTVTGTDLHVVESAMFGEVAIADWEASEDGTSATFTVPEEAVTGPVTLTFEGGEPVDSETEFTVEEAVSPTITSVEPARGIEGYPITITGENFESVTGLTVGGVELGAEDFTYNETDGTINFNIPAGITPGEGIEIVLTGSVEDVSTTDFAVDDPALYPTVTEMDVTEGAEGDPVQITGTNFAEAEVWFGDVQATLEPTSTPETLVFNVPAGAQTGPIRITTPEGYVYTEEFTVSGSTSGPVDSGDPLAYTIYEDDELTEGWDVWPGWNIAETDLANTEEVFSGNTSFKVTYYPGGGLQLHPAEPAITSTEGYENVVVSIYGGEGSGNLVFYIKEPDLEEGAVVPQVILEVVPGEWTTFTIPIEQLGTEENGIVSGARGPIGIFEFVFQDQSFTGAGEGQPNIYYFDKVGFE